MAARTVIVTGGFGTLGRAVAAAFARAGDRVARVDYAPAPAASDAALDIGGKDIADPAVAQAVVAEVTERLGAPAVLVNVAGGFVWEPLEGGGAATWERMFRMNALTAANMAQAALPALKAQPAAAIVNIGANGAVKAAAGMGGYGASKAAVHKLTESLAEELKGTGVTVNAVLPSIIDTPVNRADMPDADTSEWVQADAIADAILFLASPAARAISGALIPLTRGG